MTSPRSSSPLSRMTVLLFSGVFALVFSVGGVFAGVLPLARTLQAAWQVGSWQQVPAQVLSSGLSVSSGSEGGSTFKVQARYRYNFGGLAHESERIGLDPSGGADNIGQWQRDWNNRLSSARDRGEMVTAWVNPEDPSQALLDPSIRWPLLIFHLPFAFVFTGVGLVAAWMFFRALSGAPERVVPVADTRSSASRGQGFMWFFALFWCGISFPLAGVFWLGGSPWWVNLFVSVFVVVGLGLLWVAARQSVLAWRYAGSALQLRPSPPRAGEPVDVVLNLPARAVAEAGQGVAVRRLRLSQYRVDDSGSGSTERLVEQFDRVVGVLPDPQGGESWRVRFDVPADAPTHGGRRSGERVDWRLEILGEGDAVVVSFDVPVQAVPAWSLPGGTVPDRFDLRTQRMREEPIASTAAAGFASVPAEGSLATVARLPATVRTVEAPDAVEMHFAQPGWRWFGVIALVAAAVLASRWWLSAPLLWVGLHAVSRHRSVSVRDDALEVRVASWMGTKTRALRLVALDHLFHKMLYSQTASGGRTQEFHAVHARESDAGSAVRLTPGLPGAASAVAVAHALQAARDDRAGRFVAGARRSPTTTGWRPGVGWVLWGALVLAAVMAPTG